MRARHLAGALVLAMLAGVPARALETDQFFSWTRPLGDAREAINEKINAEIDETIAKVNARHHGGSSSCRAAAHAIREHFDHAIIAQPEIWASETSLVPRIPATNDEEARFRSVSLYSGSSPLDPIRWMPPAATIQAAGVRFGTDKLGHFFSDGGWVEQMYRHFLKGGASDEVAMRKAIHLSIQSELTVWGRSSSGIFSLGDLEANYQGMMFYRGLCGGPEPALEWTPSGWHLARRFDIGAFVTPEWDESWQPNVYTRRRWSGVKPAIESHCEELTDPAVRRRWADYATRNGETYTEHEILRLVAEGLLADPEAFSVEAVCGAGPQRRLTPEVALPDSSR